MTKHRLDVLLTERGLFNSRTHAAAAVMAGEVMLGPGWERAKKPGQQVSDSVEIRLAERPRFVSRGGIKLANALLASGVDPTDRLCLDVGASTGGFTDCLLQEGARAVTVVDVAYGELHLSLRKDERVELLERTNARELRCEQLLYEPELIAIDVSFISLTKILTAVLACAATEFDCLALVKPQFEVGRELVGKGGVVREPQLRQQAIDTVAEFTRGLGYRVVGEYSSGLPGPKGNLETFLHITRA